MALGKKKPTRMQLARTWAAEHNALACLGIGLACGAALVGLFLFVALAGFGASADFVYNQF